MANGKAYLDCPLCGAPVTTIPACNDAHRECAGIPPRETRPIWCEDREGSCPNCDSRLRVSVDEGCAELVACDEDE
jgi:hypothetical protein